MRAITGSNDKSRINFFVHSFACFVFALSLRKRTLLAGHPLWPLYTPCRLLAEHPLPLPQKCRSSNALGNARNSLSQPISFSFRLQASHPRPKALGCRLIAPAPVPNYSSRLQALFSARDSTLLTRSLSFRLHSPSPPFTFPPSVDRLRTHNKGRCATLLPMQAARQLPA